MATSDMYKMNISTSHVYLRLIWFVLYWYYVFSAKQAVWRYKKVCLKSKEIYCVLDLASVAAKTHSCVAHTFCMGEVVLAPTAPYIIHLLKVHYHSVSLGKLYKWKYVGLLLHHLVQKLE